MSQSAADNPLVCAHHFNLRDALGKILMMLTLIVSATAGGIAGISIDFALFPVDSIKTRLQVWIVVGSNDVGLFEEGGLHQGGTVSEQV